MRTRAAVAASIVAFCIPVGAHQPAVTTDTSRGLVIRYADGRMHTNPLRQTGGIWTPNFPRVAGPTPSYEGLPLSVLDIRHVAEEADVVVTVSLSYGGANKNQVTVAVVRVKPGIAVEVNELRSYGVEPITLSIVSIPSTPSNIPETVSPSALLDIRAEQSGPNASSYRVVLTNRSDMSLIWIRFDGYREGKRFSGGRGGKRAVPLVEAKSQHAFEIAIGPTGFVSGSEAHAWASIDRIEITSLMWADGTVEGDQSVVRQQRLMAERRATELRTLVDLLGSPLRQAPASLRARIAALPRNDVEIGESRKSIIADLDSLTESGRSRDDLPFDAWLGHMIKTHQDWLNRIVLPRIDR